ncbi:hypothetical protein HY522_09205 [bacterium]|nr:hypothetical protein [bacterium]
MKQRFFRVILKMSGGILFVILILCGTEGILRLTKIGRPPAFFSVRATAEGEKLSINPDYVARYFFYQPFRDVRMKPRMPWRREFISHNTPGQRRVIILGESSTQGYPHPRRLAFPALAEQMLAIRHPHLRFEVINSAVVALNSFSVLDFGRHLIRGVEPDAVVVYAGHNEFHGVFGSAARTPFVKHGPVVRGIQTLWSTHFYTYLERIFHGAFQMAMRPKESGVPMEALAKNYWVRPGDVAHRAAVENFRNNLTLLMDEASKSGVPVVLMPPVSNLQDMPPLSSVTGSGRPFVETSLIHEWERLMAENRFDELRRGAESLVSEDSAVAIGHYYLGKAFLALGDSSRGRDELEASRELDALHFRACQDLIDVVLSFAHADRRPAGSNVHVVDPRPAFRQVSRSGIPGMDLFYEHVHPNFLGNVILAWSAVLGIEKVLGLTSEAPDFPHEIYFNRIVQMDIDQFISSQKILRLLEDWPYGGRIEMESLRRAAERSKADAWSRMDQIRRNALLEAGSGVMKWEDLILYANIGHSYLSAGQPLSAIPFLELAYAEQPDEADVPANLGLAYLLSGHPERAVPILARASKLDPTNPVTLLNLGVSYLRTRQMSRAEESIREAIRLNPHLTEARELLARIKP